MQGDRPKLPWNPAAIKLLVPGMVTLYLTSSAPALNNAALMDETQPVPARILSIVRTAILAGLKTTLFLARIMIPVSLAVTLLTWMGLLPLFADLLTPVMSLLGLPGEAALVLVSSVFLNVYSAIAVIQMLSLSLREITILAVMTVIAHNLLVETAVMKKAGSSAVKMILLRLGWAVVLGGTLNFILPAAGVAGVELVVDTVQPSFLAMMGTWGVSSLGLMGKILLLVCGIMVTQRLMEEFKVMYFLSRLLAPLMRFFGLSAETSFLWIVVNIAGYAYGAAVIMDRVNNGKMKPRDADLFNHHASLCHSLFEDTALYLAIGAPLFWLTVPRLLAATVVVWVERIRRHRFRRSFRVGTI
jgi:spore maturation protein SpmB